MAVKTLTIDGNHVGAEESETILEAATDAGISIPTLCHLDGLSNVAACRLCLVEVAGTTKLLPSCVTNVAEGMEVKTDTERLRKYRAMILELLFAERNHICSVCVSNGHCELQATRNNKASRMSGSPIFIRMLWSTRLTNGSWLTTTAAYFARDACAFATRSRALTRGMLWAVEPTRV